MRYYSTGQNHHEQKPKRKSWQFLHRIKSPRRKYRQTSEATTLRLYNPYKTKTTSHGFKIKGSFLPLIFISWIALLLYLPYFRINKITYSGLQIIKPAELDEIINNQLAYKNIVWPINNYFIFNDSSLQKLLENKFSVNSIIVTKIFPNSLDIQVQEKTSAGIYDNGEGYYLLDNEGNNIRFLRSITASEFIFPTGTATTSLRSMTSSDTIAPVVHQPDYQGITNEFGDFPIIYDRGSAMTVRKNNYLDAETMQGLIAFFNALKAVKSFTANYFIINQGAEAGTTVITNKPFSIKFKPTANIDEQISRLQIFLKYNHPLEYVDLRFGDRLYWK